MEGHRHFPDGPATTWHLSGGSTVRYYQKSHDPPGRDSIKVLEVARPGKPPQVYHFATWHAGYSFVELRTDPGGELLWIVDPQFGTVGCSLDLASGRFTDEGDSHPPPVGLRSGAVLRPSTSWHTLLW